MDMDDSTLNGRISSYYWRGKRVIEGMIGKEKMRGGM